MSLGTPFVGDSIELAAKGVISPVQVSSVPRQLASKKNVFS